MTHKIKWTVSLNNGETFFEDKGQFKMIPGELSPWNKLTKYLQENKLEITSLGLYTDKGHRFNLPSLGNTPKFQIISSKLITPLDYNYFHAQASEIGVKDKEIVGEKEVTDWYTVVEAIYSNCKLQIWVDENNPNNSWSLLVQGGEYD